MKMERIEALDKILLTLEKEFSNLINHKITRDDIGYALFLIYKEKKNLEHPLDLWDVDVDLQEARVALSDFDFNTVLARIETHRDLIPRDVLMSYKVRIKKKGIWVIHRYDPDPFPSNPHAHLIDSNIKLDLTNGNCYRNREHIYTIKKKDLLFIREEARKNFKLPELRV